MTLGEFRELTKDFPDSLTLCASAGERDGDNDLFDSLPVTDIFGLDLVATGEYDFIELFITTNRGE